MHILWSPLPNLSQSIICHYLATFLSLIAENNQRYIKIITIKKQKLILLQNVDVSITIINKSIRSIQYTLHEENFHWNLNFAISLDGKFAELKFRILLFIFRNLSMIAYVTN